MLVKCNHPLDCIFFSICLSWFHSLGDSKKEKLFTQFLFDPVSLYRFGILDVQCHCVKSLRIRSYSGPYFPTFRLHTKRYFASLRIQSKCGKIRTRITPNTDIFYAVCSSNHLFFLVNFSYNNIVILDCFGNKKFIKTHFNDIFNPF